MRIANVKILDEQNEKLNKILEELENLGEKATIGDEVVKKALKKFLKNHFKIE